MTKEHVVFSESEPEKAMSGAEEELEPACTLSDLCRLCASLAAGRPGTRHIFNQQPALASMINTCLPLKVSEDDSLPLLVCGECLGALHTSYGLRTFALRAQQDLTRLLRQELQIYEEDTPAAPSLICPQHAPIQEPASHSPVQLKTEPPGIPPTTTHKKPPLRSYPAPRQKKKADKKAPEICKNTLELAPKNNDEEKGPSQEEHPKISDNAPPLTPNNQEDENAPKMKSSLGNIYKHQCRICHGKFKFFSGYTRHMSGHKIFLCQGCPQFECASKEELNLHKETCPQLYCTLCKRKFKSANLCKYHMNKHNDVREYVCDICEKGFFTPNELFQHKRTHAPPQNKCKICSRLFVRKGSLRVHTQNVHNKQWTFNCNGCNKTFKNEPKILSHLSLCHSENYDSSRAQDFYTKISPYQCAHCEKYFSTRHRILLHLKQVHGLMLRGCVFPLNQKTSEKRFMCDYCGKVFRIKTQLKSHMNRHKQIRDFKCSYCEKTFSTKQLMRDHEGLHTGEKRHRCKVCDERFRSYVSLRLHKLKHSDAGPVPFTCSYCGQGCKTKFRLQIHERVHTGERPLECQFCGQRFKQWTDRMRHIKAKHAKQ